MPKDHVKLTYCPNCGNKDTFDEAEQHCPDCDVTFKIERGAVRPAKTSRIDKLEERLSRAESLVEKVANNLFNDNDEDGEVF